MITGFVFMQGVLAALSLVAALAFGRMWRQARDRFFLLFALAFVVLGASWVGIAWEPGEHLPYPYLTRLLAFLMILAAIVDKNRRG